MGKNAVRVTGAFEQPVYSADRKLAALGGNNGEVAVIDTKHLELTRTIRVAPPGNDVRVAAWPSSDRVVAVSFNGKAPLPYVTRVSLADVSTGRLIATERFRDQDAGGSNARTRSGLVPLLVASRTRLAPARILIVSGEGRMRIVTLDRLSAGVDSKHGYLIPSLAVDPVGERAYVLEADRPVAIVDLRTSRVRYEPLAALNVGPLRAPHPPGPTPRKERRRQAVWLGDGRIAISGSDSYFPDYAFEMHGFEVPWQTNSMRPSGLMLLDTRTWRVRMLDHRPVNFEWLGGRLVASGRTLPHERRTDPMLVAFKPDGRPAYAIRGDRDSYWQTFGDRIFVMHPGRELEVRDVRSGRVLGHVPGERLAGMGPC